MRRWAPVLLVTVVMVVFASACQTPSAPAGWVAPKFVAADLSDTAVAAGATFTVSGAVSDDQEVRRVDLYFTAPNGHGARVPCTDNGWEPAALIAFEMTCAMPAIAPNGTWKASLLAGDEQFGFGPEGLCYCAVKNFTFTVVDGTTDLTGPHVDSVAVSPNPAPVGSPLAVTVVATDDHPSTRPQALYTNYGGSGIRTCTQAADVAISATQHEYHFDCPPETSPGDYAGLVVLADEMGFVTSAPVSYQVVPAAP